MKRIETPGFSAGRETLPLFRARRGPLRLRRPVRGGAKARERWADAEGAAVLGPDPNPSRGGAGCECARRASDKCGGARVVAAV